MISWCQRLLDLFLGSGLSHSGWDLFTTKLDSGHIVPFFLFISFFLSSFFIIFFWLCSLWCFFVSIMSCAVYLSMPWNLYKLNLICYFQASQLKVDLTLHPVEINLIIFLVYYLDDLKKHLLKMFGSINWIALWI